MITRLNAILKSAKFEMMKIPDLVHYDLEGVLGGLNLKVAFE
jgi:hypothetical protein